MRRQRVLFIKGVVNPHGVISHIMGTGVKFNLGRINYAGLRVVNVLNVGSRIPDVVVALSPTWSRGQRHDRSGHLRSARLLRRAYWPSSPIDDRMLILINVERLPTGAETSLVDAVVR